MNQEQEKEFDEKFCIDDTRFGGKKFSEDDPPLARDIKSFINHAIQTARADLKREMMEKMPKEMSKLGDATKPFYGTLAARSHARMHNELLSEIKQSLEQL